MDIGWVSFSPFIVIAWMASSGSCIDILTEFALLGKISIMLIMVCPNGTKKKGVGNERLKKPVLYFMLNSSPGANFRIHINYLHLYIGFLHRIPQIAGLSRPTEKKKRCSCQLMECQAGPLLIIPLFIGISNSSVIPGLEDITEGIASCCEVNADSGAHEEEPAEEEEQEPHFGGTSSALAADAGGWASSGEGCHGCVSLESCEQSGEKVSGE